MSMYLQLGHESWSLLDEADGGDYRGVVLTPVNDGPEYVIDRLSRLRDRRDRYEVILDPQLYNPAGQKGRLGEWKFYSSDFETADRSDPRWWGARSRDVVDEGRRVGADAVCSPAFLGRAFSNDYYRFTVDVGDECQSVASNAGLDALLTVIVSLRDLESSRRANEIASIVSGTVCDRIYLIFLADDIRQAQPLNDAGALASAIHLVKLLSAQFRVHVAFCGHDVVLWKSVGAEDVSSGKWLNVRRFSPGRWQEDESKGRIIAYWNEESLLTLVRDQEALRLDRQGWFRDLDDSDNPASKAILEVLKEGQGKPWLKLSWLQYLRWFSNTEARVRSVEAGEQLLLASDQAWNAVDKMKLLFTDRFNDGSHVRGWLNALREGVER